MDNAKSRVFYRRDSTMCFESVQQQQQQQQNKTKQKRRIPNELKLLTLLKRSGPLILVQCHQIFGYQTPFEVCHQQFPVWLGGFGTKEHGPNLLSRTCRNELINVCNSPRPGTMIKK